MSPETVMKEMDPVCGREVGTDSEYSSEYNGITYYFCSAIDKAVFDEHPEEYAYKNQVGMGARPEDDENLESEVWQEETAKRESRPAGRKMRPPHSSRKR